MRNQILLPLFPSLVVSFLLYQPLTLSPPSASAATLRSSPALLLYPPSSPSSTSPSFPLYLPPALPHPPPLPAPPPVTRHPLQDENVALIRDPQVRAFCLGVWHQRNIVSGLLECLGYSKATLKKMSEADQLGHIFCSHLSLLHRNDETSSRELPYAQKKWAEAQKRAHPKEKHSVQEHLAIEYLKDIMVGNATIGVPTAVANLLHTVDPEGEVPRNTVDELLAVIRPASAANSIQPFREDFLATVCDWTVWRVLPRGGGNKFFVHTSGHLRRSSVISVLTASGPLFVQESTGNMGVSSFSLMPTDLDLRHLLLALPFTELMQNLMILPGTTQPFLALLDDPSNLAVASQSWLAPSLGREGPSGVDDAPTLVPLLDAAAPRSAEEEEAAPAPSILVPRLNDERHLDRLHVVEQLLGVRGSMRWDPIASELVHDNEGGVRVRLERHTFDYLVSCAVLVSVQQEESLGDVMVQLNREKIKWTGSHMFSFGVRPLFQRYEPSPEAGYLHEKSKVRILTQLHLEGWSPADSQERRTLKEYRREAPRKYFRSYTKSKWYFLCLHGAQSVFLKFPEGHTGGILHQMPEGYYQSLVRLPPGEKFNEVLLMSQRHVSDADFKMVLLSQAPLPPPDNSSESETSQFSPGFLSSVGLSSGVERGPKRICRFITSDMGAPLPPSVKDRIDIEIDVAALYLPRPDLLKDRVIVGTIFRLTVLFDGGNPQRSYTPCLRRDHGRCCKWRFCHLEANRRDLCAYAVAWALTGLRQVEWTHEQHRFDETFLAAREEAMQWIPENL